MPLGVLEKDEVIIRDMIDIMATYLNYTPVDQSGLLQPTIFYGDGLSCERAHDAHVCRANHPTGVGRLEGLHPAIQEWHHRALYLQVEKYLLTLVSLLMK